MPQVLRKSEDNKVRALENTISGMASMIEARYVLLSEYPRTHVATPTGDYMAEEQMAVSIVWVISSRNWLRQRIFNVTNKLLKETIHEVPRIRDNMGFYCTVPFEDIMTSTIIQ